MTYDVLTEPWIPAVDLSGKRVDCGMLYAIENAHALREIAAESPLETYAMQRTMIAFLMDAYCLDTVYDREELMEEGRFDMAIIDRYIDTCKGEGVSFDLFDPKRPFMQAPYDAAMDDGKEKPAANLFHAIPTGNNHLHFDHMPEHKRSFTPAECLRGMLASYVFATAMAQGYPSSVNDTPCYYMLIQGNNLFETWVSSMISKDECLPIAWDRQPIAWRNLRPIKREDFPDVSMLSALTWQPRRITLRAEETGKVYRIWYSQGRNFSQNGLWKDPHVSYAINKKGEEYSLKPNSQKEPWRDVGTLALSSEKAGGRPRPAMIIRQYKKLTSNRENVVRIELFGLITNQAKYNGWVHDRLNVPSSILLDFDKADRLRADMAAIESIAAALETAIRRMEKQLLFGQKEDAKKKKPLNQELIPMYFLKMHAAVFGRYFDELDKADTAEPGWEKRPMEVINEKIASIARDVLGQAITRTGSSARHLQAQESIRSTFEKDLRDTMRERTENAGKEDDEGCRPSM